MKRNTLWASLLAIGALVTGCGNGKPPLDTPSRGSITIAADESFKPLVSQITSAYEGIYQDVHFNVVFRPEQEAINMMLHD
ncbi:MAG: phosphate ABC transporter substrate-binding protein, partial [Cytophagaceae bacterium]